MCGNEISCQTYALEQAAGRGTERERRAIRTPNTGVDMLEQCQGKASCSEVLTAREGKISGCQELRVSAEGTGSGSW